MTLDDALVALRSAYPMQLAADTLEDGASPAQVLAALEADADHWDALTRQVEERFKAAIAAAEKAAGVAD